MDKIIALWEEFKAFADRVVGWLMYVLGGSDDPYDYEDFPENKYD